jgi:hypothetical protein
MSEPENLGISDSDFWSQPFKKPARPQGPVPPGIVLAVPTRVALGARQSLPVLIRRRSSLKDDYALPFARHALVHAVDLDRNELYSGLAVVVDNVVYPQIDSDELERMNDSEVTRYEVSDLRTRIDLPWRPAQLLVTATLRDKISNSRRVQLGAGPAGYEDPAVTEFLEAQRGRKPPPEPCPLPGDPLPAYTKLEDSPPAPKQAGIAVGGDRVTVLADGAQTRIFGSMRVPIRKQDLVPAEAEAEEKAVVAVHLVLVGADDAEVSHFRLRVPIYGEAVPGELAVGYFAFDLLSRVIVAEKAQTYFLYGFCRDVVMGPSPFAFVTRDMLPPGAA